MLIDYHQNNHLADKISNNVDAAITQIIRLSEKYFDRVDPCALIELLPPTTPVALILDYSKRVIEYASVKKRNYQVRVQ